MHLFQVKETAKAVLVIQFMTVVIIFTVVEGLALLDLGVSPYSGDVFHEVNSLTCLNTDRKMYITFIVHFERAGVKYGGILHRRTMLLLRVQRN